MRLWLNDEYYLQKEDIVGIFDLDNSTVEAATKTTLKRFEAEGNLIVSTEEIPVSFVLTAEKQRDGKQRIFFSRYAPRSLRRRAERKGS